MSKLSHKIFGIGVAKTGTVSLGLALKRLGFNHISYDENLNEKYNQGEYEIILKSAEKYDSFEDGPWNQGNFYKMLDKRFPQSKFILTIREMESWVSSHEKHFSARELIKNPTQLWKRQYTDEKKADLIRWHQQRTDEVINYFADQADRLLIMDICGGEGWEKLCNFLGFEIPDQPFPKANVTAKRNLSTVNLWKKIIQSKFSFINQNF